MGLLVLSVPQQSTVDINSSAFRNGLDKFSAHV